ncbi:DUF4331 domain-containing protein [Chitinivorax sp. PXF-14]|uniref:DUF4331 domain-containing protein n=1 Tax=Chitinivorax sp. PXF-14 TaxID=3230488 RepID=UPI003466EB52
MKRSLLATLVALGPVLLGTALPAYASSHREAPFITRMPKVDGTDFYMFRSYEAGRGDYVTLIANYSPLQDSYGGPNYFSLDPDALYEIHIDNNGDAKEDLSFQFQFKNTLKDLQVPVGDRKVSVPLLNIGGISSVNPEVLNVRETYSVNVTRGERRGPQRNAVSNADTGATVFDKPVDNIGNKSIPDYAGYAARHVYNINVPGCGKPGRMFVGQRKEGFGVNLGEIFDLVNIKAPATAFDPGAEDKGLNIATDKNITSIELELPIACLTHGADPVIGAWTTASIRQARLINPVPGSDNRSASKEGGAWAQVSRLGMPLVNELVIGLKDKDRFNASKPRDDAQFASYVTHPTLPALLEILFGNVGVKAPTNFPRNDLVTAFLTGVPGLNQPAGVKAAEMLRLNTATPAMARGAQQRLGVIGGDNAGFPNGRRPGDDVVDIELRVAMGRLCTLNLGCRPADAPAGGIDFTDGALVNDSQFDAAFPYLKTPLPGSPFDGKQ